MEETNSRENYVVVIGAANIDIGGTSFAPLIAEDSNPGNITTSCGGVGRNIAQNLAALGMPVYLITALGSDYAGNFIREGCMKAGINMTYSLTVPDENSSIYLYINDTDGEMALAMSHTKIIEKVTPEYLDSVESIISGAAAVVTDCNITQETFLHVKDMCLRNSIPMYLDPVSTAHSEKIKGHLDGLDTVKPNRLEAGFLTGMTLETESDYKAAAHELINQGVRRVFISMGASGVIAADKDDTYFVECIPVEAVSTTGAGDSAAAAIIWASLCGEEIGLEEDNDISGLIRVAKAANAVAAMTVSVKETNDPYLSKQAAIDKIINSNMKARKI